MHEARMFARTFSLCYPAPMNRESPDMVRLRNPNPGAEPQRRRPWWLVPIASGLILAVILALIIAAIFYSATHPSVAGTWVGTGNVEGTSGPMPLAVSMDLSQQFFGDLSGTGQICVPTPQGASKFPIKVTGNINRDVIKLTIQLADTSGASGNGLPPKTLSTQGALANDTITLTAVNPSGLLSFERGSQTGSTPECTIQSET